MKLRTMVCIAVCAALVIPSIAGTARGGSEKTGRSAAKSGAAHDGHHADTAAAEAAKAAHERALKDGWPDTPVGMVAARWVEAFDAGDDEMRDFLEQHLTAEALKERPMKVRMESYLALRERFGDLMLAKVAHSAPAELTVVLLAEDASQHHFVFTVDEDAPHRLVKVAVLQGHGHGGHGGH